MRKYDADSFPALAERACTDQAASLMDLAKLFRVNRRTICRWMQEYPEFLKAVMAGRVIADDLAVNAIFQRAVGIEYTEISTETKEALDRDGSVRTLNSKRLTQKRVPPDVEAAEFWLTNRRPAEWRHKRELTGADGGPIPVSIQELEALKGLDVRELIRLHSDALAQSRSAQPESPGAGAGGGKGERGHQVVDQ